MQVLYGFSISNSSSVIFNQYSRYVPFYHLIQYICQIYENLNGNKTFLKQFSVILDISCIVNFFTPILHNFNNIMFYIIVKYKFC